MDGIVETISNLIIAIAEFFGVQDPSYRSAIGCGVGLLSGLLMATVLSWAYFHRARHSHYAELDRIYFDLLKLRVEHPDVVAADGGASTEKQRRYSYMIWTLLETIFDRARESELLQLTWQPIIRTEGRAHIAYLADNKNRDAFQIGFLQFIRSGGFRDYCNVKDELKLNAEFERFAAIHLADVPPLRRSFSTHVWNARWRLAAAAALLVVILSAVGAMIRNGAA